MSGGTVFKGIVAKGANTDEIQIELTSTNRVVFSVNKFIFEVSPETSRLDFNGVCVMIRQNEFSILFSNGIRIDVSITEVKDALFLMTTVPRQFEGLTSGLLGLMDNNKENDFTLPSGQILNILPSDDREVFNKFG